MSEQEQTFSVVIPARNEAEGLQSILPELRRRHPQAEILVVDDGSTDATPQVAAASGARVLRQPYSMGNGAAIKAGARAASGPVIVFMDADGQHSPGAVDSLLAELGNGYEMVVGARTSGSHASLARRLANACYNLLASWITGRRVLDLTSGFRAVRADRFREFLHLLPNGFSYPTTITMCFLRAGYPVKYVPITAAGRVGKSHIRPLRDGLRFILIIFRIGTLYSPLKIFFPVSALLFLLGLGNYAYTYATVERFTNMSALLLLASVLVFLIGLVSEQITALMFQRQD
jgi:glycosyltransferase involved in cell wall biosynthesis